jgi:hypothetical protein
MKGSAIRPWLDYHGKWIQRSAHVRHRQHGIFLFLGLATAFLV